jgi:plasmid stability protein
MARIKTTLSLDERLLRQIRVRAARTGRRDSDVMEEVVREGLGSLERLRGRARLSEDEALDLASDVVHEVRANPQDTATTDFR